MTLVLDTGALVALERRDRAMWRRLKLAVEEGSVPVTHGAIVGQAWRGGARQAMLARALSAFDVRPLDEALGRRAGALLARARRNDVVDAALALLASDGDAIVTSDPKDIAALATAADLDVEIIET
ncbi:MAG: hypothetical protein JST00_32625 [Deltaproteobacteria bacterium]|nr:hypothetical protein [Deltaproteobacteria bacterium]